jgi:hypothetical protein
MENGCLMELSYDNFSDPDGEPFCWVRLSYEDNDHLALWPDPSRRVIEVRPRNEDDGWGWEPKVEGPDDVLRYMRAWAELRVIPPEA